MSERRSSRPAQRWPDVMIGVLTLALLGGFGTLLLNQHKPVEVAAQPQPKPVTTIPASPGTVPEPLPVAPPAPVPQPQAAQPKAAEQPGTTQQAGASAKTAPSAAVTASATPAPSTSPATDTTGAANPSTPAAPQTTATPAAPSPTTAPAPTSTDPTLAPTTEIPPVPKEAAPKPIAPPVLPKTTPAASAQASTTTAAPTPTNAAQTQTAQPSAAQTTPAQPTPANPPAVRRAGGAVATSENRTPLRSDYRISLGSFSTPGTVNSQTAAVDALGYKVHAINLGDQYVAQVGPFADEASARQALADIQRAYPGALLYRPKAKASATADNSSNADSTPSSAAPSETRRTGRKAADSSSSATDSNDTAAAAPSGPTYLQVGAFDRVESAQQLVGTLKDAGFAPTVNNPPDHKTTVMVGPYSGRALRRAEARLDSAGLDHFRVR